MVVIGNQPDDVTAEKIFLYKKIFSYLDRHETFNFDNNPFDLFQLFSRQNNGRGSGS